MPIHRSSATVLLLAATLGTDVPAGDASAVVLWVWKRPAHLDHFDPRRRDVALLVGTVRV